jgi:DNA repair protein RecO (recombination protein O)
MTAFRLVKADLRWYLADVNPARSNPAIILRWRAYGESDKIVTFLTRDFGKLTGIAKGARRSRRRFVNSLEPLARVEARFRQRTGASLAFLESCDLFHPPGDLTQPSRFAYASYLAELTEQMTAEEQPVPELYALLEDGLSVLATRPASGAFLRAFELRLLARAGYGPQIEQCHTCRQILPSDRPSLLDLRQGTILCAGCAGKTRAPAVLEVGRAVLARLTSLRDRALSDCGTELLEGIESEAASVTGRLLALHLARPLKSLRFIAQTTAAGRPPGCDLSALASAVSEKRR